MSREHWLSEAIRIAAMIDESKEVSITFTSHHVLRIHLQVRFIVPNKPYQMYRQKRTFCVLVLIGVIRSLRQIEGVHIICSGGLY